MQAAKRTYPKYINAKLKSSDWRKQKSDHKKKVSLLIDDYLARRSRQQKDPVMDFLFEYYAFRPSHLKQWSPGFGALLLDGTSEQWPFEEFSSVDNNSFLDIDCFSKDRIPSLKWITKVLENSAKTKPSFGCFGMHEWAMVYKRENIRHSYLPLRMSPKELTDFVDSRPILCTHFDAFRFFSEEAKPQNKYELNRKNFANMEQPGCLHTNMDLYKWAFKMYPWISSKTIRQAFELALETRVMDMRASPYDLRKRGLEPIKIETEAGRREYMQKQQAIFEKARPIRAQLIKEYTFFLGAIRSNSGLT